MRKITKLHSVQFKFILTVISAILVIAVLVGGLEMRDGHVVVGRDCSTNLPGCYAAGDCTGRPYQYAKAVGEGNVAAHGVSEYIK